MAIFSWFFHFRKSHLTLEHELDNYRPISILPALSKILERIVYKQLLSHLENNGLLSSFQFGFRSKRSTELAVTYFTDKIRKEVDNGNILGVLFLSIYQKYLTLLVTRAFLISCRLMELTIRSFIGLLIICFLERNQSNSKVLCQMPIPYFPVSYTHLTLPTIYSV